MSDQPILEKTGRGPTIGSELLRKKEERKGAGAGLLAKLGLGSGLNAGLLASKAGVAALLVAGGSVAGGVMMFRSGGGAEGTRSSFFNRAEGAVGAMTAVLGGEERDVTGQNAGAVASDGASASLDKFRTANLGAADGDGSSQGGKAVSGGQAADAVASAENTVQAPNNDIGGAAAAAAGASGARPKMVTGTGFSGKAAAGGGGASASSGAPAAAGNTADARRAAGALSSGESGAMGGSVRATMGARQTSAVSSAKAASAQAMGTNKVVQGNLRGPNVSSQGSGGMYDGGRGSGVSSIGTTASSADSDAGYASRETGLSAAKVNPNTSLNLRETPAPPAADGGKAKNKKNKDYEALLWTGVGLIAAAGLLIMFAGNLKKKADTSTDITGTERTTLYTTVKWLAGIAGILATAAAAIGIVLATQYDQKQQGMMIAGIGAVAAMYAGTVVWDAFASEKQKVGQAAEMSFWEKMILGKLK